MNMQIKSNSHSSAKRHAILMRRYIRYLLVLCMFGSTPIILWLGIAVGNRIAVRNITVPIGVGASIRIATLSDIHIRRADSSINHARRAIQMVRASAPDVVCLLGDYVTGCAGIAHLESVLVTLRAPLGVYAVLGNHDHWADAEGVAKALRRAGIQVLNNANIAIAKDNVQFYLVGIDDLWSGKPDWDAAFANVPADAVIILLSHNPDAILTEYAKRARLVLSGHTHAGQVAFIGAWFIPASRYGRKHPHGLYREGETFIYITSGVTTGASSPRWFTRPEVAIVEVK
ncbi:MAG TPA: metallophosphoesterase [Armatimonadetes bacterium]|nr:metallophosphoesterase [Armatimonadota bacterium]